MGIGEEIFCFYISSTEKFQKGVGFFAFHVAAKEREDYLKIFPRRKSPKGVPLWEQVKKVFSDLGVHFTPFVQISERNFSK